MYTPEVSVAAEGHTLTLLTRDDATFNHLWMEPVEQYVQLQIQAERSAHVALATVAGDITSSAIEVVFGAEDNSK